MALFKNGAPQFIALGADDQSGRPLSPQPDAQPQHLPLFHIMAPKGTTDRAVLAASDFITVYGNEAFDKNLGFYNHQTRFLEAVGAEGNVCMVKRIVPEDAGAKANATVYLDVLECPVPNYERNSQGDLVTDPVTNQYKINQSKPTVDGYKIKWIKEFSDTEEDLGLKVTKTGTMKYLPDTSKLPESYLKVSNIPMLVKATTEFKLETETNAAGVEISVDNPNIVEYIESTGMLQAKANGNVVITVRTKDKNFKASRVQFGIEVVNTDPGELVEMKVNTDGTFMADKNNQYIPYNIEIEANGFAQGISDNFRVAHVDQNGSRIVVNSNGQAMIGFVGVGGGKVSNMCVMTIKGSGFTDEDVPSTYFEVTSVITKMKAGTTQTLNIDQNFGVLSLHSNNEPAFMVDTATRRVTARTPGIGMLTIKATNPNDPNGEPVQVQIELEIVAEDVPEATTINLNTNKRILRPNDKTLKLDVQVEDGAGVGFDFDKTSLVKFDENNLSVTAIGATNEMCLLGAIATHEGKTPVVSYHSIYLEMDPAKTESADMQYSKMYPIFQLKAKNQGSWYNNIGFAVGSLQNADIDPKILSELKALPFAWSFFTRTSPKVSPVVFRNLYAEPSMNIVFKEKATHPSTEARIDFEEVLQNNWFNETDPLKAFKYWDYEGFKFYRENFFEVCKKFVEKEAPYVTKKESSWSDEETSDTISWFDFTTENKQEMVDNEYLLINPFICKSSKQKMYFTLRISNEASTLSDKQSEVTMSLDTPIFLSGGGDGTLSNEMFERGVVKEMANYVDPDSTYQDLAINIESVLYDSGFTLDTKKELVNFITLRKDTAVIFTDHDDSMGEKTNVLSDARAIAVAIGNRLKLAPESEYFGTPVCRAMVMVGTGKLRDGTTSNRIPLTYEIAIKAARMMGASNGIWDSSQLFDRENMVEQLTDVQPNFVPSGIKATLWDDGIVWPQPYNRSSFHFPALQTIYSDDTSVLNNYFAMMCLLQLTKLGDRMWRKFTGTATMSNGEFIDAVNTAAMDDLKGRFGGLFNVVVECQIDEQDEQRGYSWHLVTKLYGSTLKTVLVHNSVVYRTENTDS